MTTTEQAARPVPAPDDASRPFFDAAARGVLMLQRCTSCGAYHFPLREVCPECLSTDLEWAESAGRGTLHTFGVMHRVYHPAFADAVPYNLAVVELEEGPRMNSTVVECSNEDLEVGMPLEVTFTEVAPAAFLPQFRPRT